MRKNSGNIFLIVLAIVGILTIWVGGYFWWSTQKSKTQPINEKSSSGIYGTATIGPTCPGAQREGQICEKPYQGTIVIGKNILIPGKPDSFEEKIRFQTNSDGGFRVDLPSGDYVAKAADAGFDRFNFSKTLIHVLNNKFTKVDILFDTGIR